MNNQQHTEMLFRYCNNHLVLDSQARRKCAVFTDDSLNSSSRRCHCLQSEDLLVVNTELGSILASFSDMSRRM